MSPSIDYLAGILDTGGHLSMRTCRGYTYPVIRLGGKSPMLELFAERFGGTVCSVPSRPNFFWCRQATACQAVLRELRPRMRFRLEEIDELLAWRPENRLKANGSIVREARRRGVEPVLITRASLPPIALSIGEELLRGRT